MKYWFDTEFIERPCTIDLISIGIVSEDGREYYAINEECDFNSASTWVKENVLSKLPLPCRYSPAVWSTKEEIKNDILAFVGDDKNPEFWAYYADYDWVVFCWLFGTMIELPTGWPMYCKDLKQLADSLGIPALPKQEGAEEHHALNDAIWTKKAWESLQSNV